MKLTLTLTLTLTTLLLTTTTTFALPSHFNVRDCTPADGVATDGNMFWADNCDLGAGEDGWGQKNKRHGGPPGGGPPSGHKQDQQQQQQQSSNSGDGGHDANWNGVYEQTPNCTPADGAATDGNQFWADNCDLGAGENGWGQ